MSLGARVLAAVVMVLAAAPLALLPRIAHAQSPGVTEFPIPPGYGNPFEITTGSDGNLWFSELNRSVVERVSPLTDVVTEYHIPQAYFGTGGIAAGPDGNIWFADRYNNTVGNITPSGAVTEYASLQTSFAYPEAMTGGPDGNLWFTENNANFIGKVTTSGTITEYPVSANAGGLGITSGPDGNLWFVEQSSNNVARITTAGVLTEFALTSGASPAGIVAGPDGNLWVTENGTGNIDKVSTSGSVLAQYAVPTSNAGLGDIRVGPDGNLWFTETNGNAIGEVTTGGTITEIPLGTGSGPYGIATGPDGNVWYTGYNGVTVGRYAPGACAGLIETAGPAAVQAGAAETFGLTVSSCGNGPLQNATSSGTTTVPPGCPAAPVIAPFTSPSLAYGQTDAHSEVISAPSCPGTYTVNFQTAVGSTVMATASSTYAVQALGNAVMFTTSTAPRYVASGSDNSLWYTDGRNIIQVTPAGVVQRFRTSLAHPQQLTSGTDGSLYFSNAGTQIAKVTPGSPPTVGTTVPVPGSIHDLTPGPDGNIWFTTQTSSTAGSVGFLTPTAKVKVFTLPAGSGVPMSITTGADNALWFTLSSGHIGRISPSGIATLYAVPGTETFASSGGLALGPDGNVWFTSVNTATGDVVGSVSPGGAISEFATPTANANVTGITAGADGNLWFNEPGQSSCVSGSGVGQVTVGGAVSEYTAGCTDIADLFNIVAGPDGNVWNAATNGIGAVRINIESPSTCSPLAISSNPNPVSQGSTEAVSIALSNCVTSSRLMKVVTRTTPPSGCGTTTTSKVDIPLGPRLQTAVNSSFTAPSCSGTYTVKTTLSVGTALVAAETSHIQVV